MCRELRDRGALGPVLPPKPHRQRMKPPRLLDEADCSGESSPSVGEAPRGAKCAPRWREKGGGSGRQLPTRPALLRGEVPLPRRAGALRGFQGNQCCSLERERKQTRPRDPGKEIFHSHGPSFLPPGSTQAGAGKREEIWLLGFHQAGPCEPGCLVSLRGRPQEA